MAPSGNARGFRRAADARDDLPHASARNGQSTRVMSAIGTKQTSVRVASMSALEVKRTLL